MKVQSLVIPAVISKIHVLRKQNGSSSAQSENSPARKIARARGKIVLGEKVFDALKSSKGLVFTTSQLAGINGSRRTHELIPSLGHKVPLDNVGIHALLDDRTQTVTITATVKSRSKVNIDTEAMTAVAIAALTIFDMGKQYKQKMSIQDIKLLDKTEVNGEEKVEVQQYDQTTIRNEPAIPHSV